MKYKFQPKLKKSLIVPSEDILGYIEADSIEKAQEYFAKIKNIPLKNFIRLFLVTEA
jgi:hypothetical protein|tara:strand:+ start:3953 stop:4123 length:171 start_codon:yes stop_codon:yes gene_type:complete